MTWVTTPGLEIRDRWPALTLVMWALARLAMDSSNAGGMTLSAVPITAQDGMVFQAGVPEGIFIGCSLPGDGVSPDSGRRFDETQIPADLDLALSSPSPTHR